MAPTLPSAIPLPPSFFSPASFLQRQDDWLEFWVLNFTPMSCVVFMLVVIGHSLKTASAAMLKVSPSQRSLPLSQCSKEKESRCAQWVRRSCSCSSPFTGGSHLSFQCHKTDQYVALNSLGIEGVAFILRLWPKLQTEKPVSPRGSQGHGGVVWAFL